MSRFDQLKTRERRFSSDGINSVKYTVVDRKLYSLYTRIRMKLEKEQVRFECYCYMVQLFIPLS